MTIILKIKTMRFLVLVSTLFMSFCSNEQKLPDFVETLNAKRIQLGLPILPDNWSVAMQNHDFIAWVNPISEPECDKCGYHLTKTLKFKSDTLIYERDDYYGPSKYTNIDGEFKERLEIKYYFPQKKSEHSANGKWECMLVDSAHFFDPISTSAANKILHKWKLNKYPFDKDGATQ